MPVVTGNSLGIRTVGMTKKEKKKIQKFNNKGRIYGIMRPFPAVNLVGLRDRSSRLDPYLQDYNNDVTARLS